MTALEARLRAAEVLIEADQAGDAIPIARQVISEAGSVDQTPRPRFWPARASLLR